MQRFEKAEYLCQKIIFSKSELICVLDNVLSMFTDTDMVDWFYDIDTSTLFHDQGPAAKVATLSFATLNVNVGSQHKIIDKKIMK